MDDEPGSRGQTDKKTYRKKKVNKGMPNDILLYSWGQCLAQYSSKINKNKIFVSSSFDRTLFSQEQDSGPKLSSFHIANNNFTCERSSVIISVAEQNNERKCEKASPRK